VVPQLVYCLSSKCQRRLLFPLWLMHLSTWHLYTGLPEIYLENFEKKREIINFHNYWFLIWPSYFNLSEIIRKRTVFSAKKFTDVSHRLHNYWIYFTVFRLLTDFVRSCLISLVCLYEGSCLISLVCLYEGSCLISLVCLYEGSCLICLVCVCL
jgi:hypothetical protein